MRAGVAPAPTDRDLASLRLDAAGRTPGGNARACALGGVACLTSILTVAPLVDGRSWLPPVLVAILTVSIVGVLAALVRAPAVVAAALSTVAGFVVCTSLFVPQVAALGGFLPTPASTQALASLARAGLETSSSVTVPAPDGPDIQVLICVAATGLAILVQVIAAWARHPGMAGLPLLVTLFVPAALAPDGIGAWGFVLAGAGYLALTLTDADVRVRGWGPLLRRRSAAPGTADPIVASFVGPAAITGVCALVLATVLPTLLPGIGRDNLNDVIKDTFGDGGVQTVNTVNPFLDLAKDLTRPDDIEVLTYATDLATPEPLRIVTNGVVDSQTWEPSEPELPVDQTVDGPLPSPPGATAAVLAAAPRVRTQIQVTALEQRYLPMPYPVETVAVEGLWLYDPETLNVLSGTDTTLDKNYLVTSYDIRPTAEALRAAPPPPAQVREAYTSLPELRPIVAATATEVTAGATTAYDQALALQQFFRSSGGFAYDVEVNVGPDADPMETFLTEKRGYCAQFSSAMALMARSLGIPARVAVGFLPGDPLGGGTYSVSIQDAHAWPELYFEGVGWIRFEPTPAARTGSPPPWAVPEAGEAEPSAGASSPTAAPVTTPAPAPATTAAPLSGDAAASGVGLRAVGGVLGVLLALVLVALLPRGWRALVDTLRWRRVQGDPRRAAHVAWVVLSERTTDLGWRWGRGTVREEAGALVDGAELPATAREALWRVAQANERSLFAASPAAADRLRDDVKTVVVAIGHGQTRGQRLRARWLPTPSVASTRRAGAGSSREPAAVGGTHTNAG